VFRKQGTLTDSELAILAAGMEIGIRDKPFYGFELARHMKEATGATLFVSHGSLYKALNRLLDAGLLRSEWEDVAQAQAEKRPPRRFYWVTAAGSRAYRKAYAPASAAHGPVEASAR
jgi:PadR family transcriptional regulator, regulatory protein PadR